MADIVYIVDPRTSPKRVTLRRQNDSTVNTVTTFPTVGENLLLVEDLRSGKYNISNFICVEFIMRLIFNKSIFIE